MQNNTSKPRYSVILIIGGALIIFSSLIDFMGKISWTQANILGILALLLFVFVVWLPVILQKKFKFPLFLSVKHYPLTISIIAFLMQITSYSFNPPSQYFLTLLWRLLYSSAFLLLGISRKTDKSSS